MITEKLKTIYFTALPRIYFYIFALIILSPLLISIGIKKNIENEELHLIKQFINNSTNIQIAVFLCLNTGLSVYYKRFGIYRLRDSSRIIEYILSDLLIIFLHLLFIKYLIFAISQFIFELPLSLDLTGILHLIYLASILLLVHTVYPNLLGVFLVFTINILTALAEYYQLTFLEYPVLWLKYSSDFSEFLTKFIIYSIINLTLTFIIIKKRVFINRYT